jgi:hypothetical protein
MRNQCHPYYFRARTYPGSANKDPYLIESGAKKKRAEVAERLTLAQSANALIFCRPARHRVVLRWYGS